MFRGFAAPGPGIRSLEIQYQSGARGFVVVYHRLPAALFFLFFDHLKVVDSVEVVVVDDHLVSLDVLEVLFDRVDNLVQNCEQVELAHYGGPGVELAQDNLQNFHKVAKVLRALLRVLEVQKEQVNCLVEVFHIVFKFAIKETDEPVENVGKVTREVENRQAVKEVDPLKHQLPVAGSVERGQHLAKFLDDVAEVQLGAASEFYHHVLEYLVQGQCCLPNFFIDVT